MKPTTTALLLYGMLVILLAVATTTTTIGGVYAQIPTTPPQIPTMPPTNQTTLETNATEQEQQPTPLSSSSPFSQEPQSQREEQLTDGQQQDPGDGISILPGSSALTDTAFQPNPFQASIGDRVTWVNDDSQPHTVTSGENANPDGKFDSGIMAPAADFEHTFTEAGEHPYFCLLHPNMVGTVSVS